MRFPPRQEKAAAYDGNCYHRIPERLGGPARSGYIVVGWMTCQWTPSFEPIWATGTVGGLVRIDVFPLFFSLWLLLM